MKKSLEESCFICRLCRRRFTYDEMSEEHYPAKSTGNNDIVELDLVKLIDTFQSGIAQQKIKKQVELGHAVEDAAGKYFDEELTNSLYPKGRTSRTLCRRCNTFLGKYDEAYLRFFNAYGAPNIIKGFQKKTKIQIMKSIYGKFLSVPEALDADFDFLDFIRDETIEEYHGIWHLYFVQRDFSSDLMGFADIRTGKMEFDEGVVYELSDERFIFDLMNFEKHDCFPMNSILDIFKNNYALIKGTGENGGYHAQLLMGDLLGPLLKEE